MRDSKIKDSKRVLCDMLDYKVQQEVFARCGSEGTIIKSREYISLLADEACVSACEHLYELGLYTQTSSANVVDCYNADIDAYIGIDYQTMSEENKQIANYLVQKGTIPPITSGNERASERVYIRIPINGEMTVGEVSDRLLTLAEYFKPQDVLYGRTTKEKLRQEAFVDNGDGTFLFNYLKSTVSQSEMEQYLTEMLDEYFQSGEDYFLTADLKRIHENYLRKEKEKTQ